MRAGFPRQIRVQWCRCLRPRWGGSSLASLLPLAFLLSSVLQTS